MRYTLLIGWILLHLWTPYKKGDRTNQCGTLSLVRNDGNLKITKNQLTQISTMGTIRKKILLHFKGGLTDKAGSSWLRFKGDMMDIVGSLFRCWGGGKQPLLIKWPYCDHYEPPQKHSLLSHDHLTISLAQS